MANLLGKQPKNSKIDKILFFLIVVVFVCLIAFNYTYQSVYVVGASMENTLTGSPGGNPQLKGGDYVYIFKAEPARGDIVVIETEHKCIIKRVVALGGDTVELRFGVLYVNDKVVEESYVSPENNTNFLYNTYSKTTVEEGHVFCLGDNRDNSDDSRSPQYGAFKNESIVGVVADWSLTFKAIVTAYNTFLDFTVPSLFGAK
ncbi:MAG: signal peptidase I [Candidatus Coproplasma sp.]